MPVCVSAQTGDGPCNQDDLDYAASWDNYYQPDDAYRFGEKIQSLVRARDLEKMLDLVDGELSHGPRRSYVKNKKFSDIFSEEWRQAVLRSRPSCQPVGWRGFMLDQGEVWYNKTERGWHIFAINGFTEEVFDTTGLPVFWETGKGVWSPQCFVRQWMSSDNFEEFEARYAIKDVEDFRTYTGRYLGKEIASLEAIVPSWSDGDKTIALVESVQHCQVGKEALHIEGRGIGNKNCEEFGCTEYYYEILASVSNKDCSRLAPNLSAVCQSAYLIKIGDYAGGSMGWDFGYNLYGLFSLTADNSFVAPLVNFHSENEARNYVDQLRKNTRR